MIQEWSKMNQMYDYGDYIQFTEVVIYALFCVNLSTIELTYLMPDISCLYIHGMMQTQNPQSAKCRSHQWDSLAVTVSMAQLSPAKLNLTH